MKTMTKYDAVVAVVNEAQSDKLNEAKAKRLNRALVTLGLDQLERTMVFKRMEFVLHYAHCITEDAR